MCYTYLIKCTVNNKFYYGVRWANKFPPSEDLWVKYFTSSKIVKSLIKEYGKEAFIFEIRKVFAKKNEAIAWEEKVLRRLNVLKLPDIWLNKCVSKAIRYDIHPRKNVKLEQDTKDKISKSNKGKPKWTKEQKLFMSINRSKDKHWNYGKNWSEEVKLKSSITNKKNWDIIKQDPKAMKLHIKKSTLKNVKTWLLENQNGEQIVVVNLNKFCLDNNLHASNLNAKGYSKGFKLIKCLSVKNNGM